jgi:hypothetical protein
VGVRLPLPALFNSSGIGNKFMPLLDLIKKKINKYGR